MVENLENHPFAFSIQPSKTEQRYIVEAFSIPQRVDSFLLFLLFLGSMDSFYFSYYCN